MDAEATDTLVESRGLGTNFEGIERIHWYRRPLFWFALIGMAYLYLVSRHMHPISTGSSDRHGFAKSQNPRRYHLSKVQPGPRFTICGVPLGVRKEQLSDDCRLVQGQPVGPNYVHFLEATLLVGPKKIVGIILDPPTEADELEGACSEASLEYNGTLVAQPGTPISQVGQQLNMLKLPYEESEQRFTIKLKREVAVVYQRKGVVTTFWMRQQTWPF